MRFWLTPVFCVAAVTLWAQPNSEFITEEVTFYNGPVKLSGMLYLPSGSGKFPAVAVTHGSGKESKSQPGYVSLATTLVREGFAVLVFDKRGVGGSGGTYTETPDMSQPAGDLVCAVNLLKSRKEVDNTKIGVYGHSQGGWVAPLAAVMCGDISFVSVSCGGAISTREQVIYSLWPEFRSKGFKDAQIDSALVFCRQLYTYLGTGLGYEDVNPRYDQSVKQSWFSHFRQMGFADKLPPPSMLKESHFNFFKMINYDPQATLRMLNVPVLVILSEKDDSVPSQRAKKLWEDAMHASGNSALLTVSVVSSDNHFCFERYEGGVRYKPAFASALTGWLKEKVK